MEKQKDNKNKIITLLFQEIETLNKIDILGKSLPIFGSIMFKKIRLFELLISLIKE